MSDWVLRKRPAAPDFAPQLNDGRILVWKWFIVGIGRGSVEL